MTKVVVTGGSGALGRVVVSELTANGYDVLSLDRNPHPSGHRPSWIVDLSDTGGLYEACRDAEAVIHLAAFLAPNLTSACNTFNTNATLTYNVLQAAADSGCRRVVLCSSTAAYGFIYGKPDFIPDYLPVDEDHISRPIDPYGLSKVVGERLADGFAQSGRLTVASLRLPGVSFDPEFTLLKQRMGDPGIRKTGFWAYIDVRDAAVAFRLALEADLTGHRVFNIAAPTSSMREPTDTLVRAFYPSVTDLRAPQETRWSGVSSRRAERELGFVARHVWETTE